MADISKRSGTDDCEDGERGERGERGRRGHRGHRGHRGPEGPAGPGGPATSLVGPTSGPAAQVAKEDIPAGFVVTVAGSMMRTKALFTEWLQPSSVANLTCFACLDFSCCSVTCVETDDQGPHCYVLCCGQDIPDGITTAPAKAGEIVQYVTAGALTLDTATWDASTGQSGGLVVGQTYYLSQKDPGRLTAVYPFGGTVTKIGTALSSTTLNVQIESGQTDGLTLVPRTPTPGPFSAVAYGFASGQDLRGRNNESWELGLNTILPGSPISKNLLGGTDLFGQQPASAAAWLSSHVLGLKPPKPPPLDPTDKRNPFISGGLFELTEAQWDAVWTASDPNRGVGSGLLPGYPYYLSDVPGTFFLINKTGVPPVASGNWLTKCFVALSPTTALIQISDPRQVEAPPAPPPWLPVNPVVVPPANSNIPVVAGRVNLIDTTIGGQNAVFPAASSVPNGTPIVVKNVNYGSAITLVPSGTDLIDGFPVGDGNLSSYLDNTNAALLAISDGVSNWWLRTDHIGE